MPKQKNIYVFKGLKNFLFMHYLIDFEENYVINGSICEIMFQYVFAFPSLLLPSDTVLHFCCCCCIFMTFNFWWMFIFEVELLTTVVILGKCESNRPYDEVHYCYIIRRLRCFIQKIENSHDCGNTKISFLILGQSMCSAKSEFEKPLNSILR